MILVRVAHVPVRGDQTGNGVENFWGFAGIGHRLVRSPAFLIPTARTVSVRSSGGNCSAWLVSYGISVAVEEMDWGKWGSGNDDSQD